MDQRQFMQWMETDKLPASSVDSLRQIVAEYPFFQSAHALLAKAMADNHDVLYDKHLKIAAAYCNDRKSLYQLIHRKTNSVFVPAKEEETTSPFIVKEKEERTPIVSSEIPEAEPEIIAPPMVEPVAEPVISFISPASEINTATTTPEPTDDPHEILRRRLAEILGTPVESHTVKKEQPKEVSKEIEQTVVSPSPEEMPEAYIPSAQEKVNEPETQQKTAPVTHPKSEAEITNDVSSTPATPKTVTPESLNSEIVSTLQEIKTETDQATEDAIFKANEKAIDDVDTLQLEYALEYSILSSIENLPVLDKEEEPPITDKKPATDFPQTDIVSENPFLQWLKKSAVEGFGSIEEVHADESATFTSPEVSAEPMEETPVEDESAEPEVALIDRFIATEPRIIPSKNQFYSPVSQAKKSVTEHEDLVSETLAKIYLLQGHPLKARKCYEKLSLLQPEKKTYFAALIKEIDFQLHNSENQDL